MGEGMSKLPKDLEAKRNNLSSNYDPELGPGRHYDYQDGFNAGAQAVLEHDQIKKLEKALEGLTNAALADLKPLPSQTEAGFNALKDFCAWRDNK